MNNVIIWIIFLSLLNLAKTNYTFLGTNYFKQQIEYDSYNRKQRIPIILGTSELSNTYFEFIMKFKNIKYISIIKVTCYANGTKEANLSLVDNRNVDEYDKCIQGYCLIDGLKLSGIYLYINNSLIVTTGNEMVDIDSDFEMDLNPGKYGLKMAENIIIFRQVNSFNRKGKYVSFLFHGLNSIPEKEIAEIIFEVIPLMEGIIYLNEPIYANCSLLNKEKTKNVSYKCKLEMSEEFNSLAVISSKDVSNIPNDRILIDPSLTDEGIKSGRIFNYSNQDFAKIIPPIISINNIHPKEEGKVIINMTSSDDLEVDNDIFIIPLGLPVGVELICNISKSKAIETIISECFIDGIINEEIIAFEQMRIIKGKKELFVLLNFMTRELKFNCSKSLKEKAQEKLKLTLSFRQAFFSPQDNTYFHLCIYESNPEFNPKRLKIERN